MSFSRYSRDGLIRGGAAYATPQGVQAIRDGIARNTVETTVQTFETGQRLDVLAGDIYGDSTLWWVIAAASNIGWGLQVPPGTRLTLPTSIDQIKELIS